MAKPCEKCQPVLDTMGFRTIVHSDYSEEANDEVENVNEKINEKVGNNPQSLLEKLGRCGNWKRIRMVRLKLKVKR